MKELALHQELLEKMSSQQDDPADGPSDNEPEQEEEDIEPPEIRHKKFRKTSKGSHRKGAFHFAQQEIMEAMDVSSSSFLADQDKEVREITPGEKCKCYNSYNSFMLKACTDSVSSHSNTSHYPFNVH